MFVVALTSTVMHLFLISLEINVFIIYLISCTYYIKPHNLQVAYINVFVLDSYSVSFIHVQLGSGLEFMYNNLPYVVNEGGSASGFIP
jgi:hypothetical protein